MPKYRKTKPGSFWPRKPGLPAKISKGDVVECEPALLGPHIVEFELVPPSDPEWADETTNDPAPDQPPFKLRLMSRGSGYYDVIDPATLEKVNESPLKKEEAEKLARAGRPDSRVDQAAIGG